ncbi:MAG: homocysteine S-methyltransferase [Actinomycetota bacterium]|nr:homocysteine S-methyltransferase [Actinomycetota bacterium]
MNLTDRPGITIVDGGLSTQLELMGCDISGSLWTGRALLEKPDAIESAHRAFVEAGADVLITASYQVSRPGFIEAGLTAADADRCLLRSIEVARAAGASSTIVAASVGPYGAISHDGGEYRGNYGLSAAQLRDFHRPRIEILASGSPDLLAIETIPDVREIEAIADILADFPLLPAWITFTAADGAHTCAGQPIEAAIEVADGVPSVQLVGINCTAPQFVPQLLVRITATTNKAVIAYPNAGGVWSAQNESWQEVPAASGAADAVNWVELGATWVGGCCGTDAAAISAIRSAVGCFVVER